MSVRLIAIALLVLSAAPAWAGAGHGDSNPQSKDRDEVSRPCHADFDKYCAGKVVCGKGACHACLNQHKAELDKKCAKAVERWDEAHERP